MSSTNRGYDRHKSDYYVTPINKIVLFLNTFIKDENIDLSTFDILDPCAGGDIDNPMSYPEAIKIISPNARISTIDIREDSRASHHEDYLKSNLLGNSNMIITNPPFNIALEIIKKALYQVNEKGYVIMLLRLNFFGSLSRYNFFQEYMPKYAYIHSKRLSFTKDGITDSIEYMHCVWQKGNYQKFTRTRVI